MKIKIKFFIMCIAILTSGLAEAQVVNTQKCKFVKGTTSSQNLSDALASATASVYETCKCANQTPISPGGFCEVARAQGATFVTSYGQKTSKLCLQSPCPPTYQVEWQATCCSMGI
jgi:hypothetical protein